MRRMVRPCSSLELSDGLAQTLLHQRATATTWKTGIQNIFMLAGLLSMERQSRAGTKLHARWLSRRSGRVGSAERHIAAMSVDSTAAAAHRLGNEQFVQGKYSDAVRSYTAALASSPGRWMTHLNRAACYFGMHSRDMAYTSCGDACWFGAPCLLRQKRSCIDSASSTALPPSDAMPRTCGHTY